MVDISNISHFICLKCIVISNQSCLSAILFLNLICNIFCIFKLITLRMAKTPVSYGRFGLFMYTRHAEGKHT